MRGTTSHRDDAAILRVEFGLAGNLRLKVLAEGAETAEQMKFLRREGCDEIQGYLIGKPMPAEDFTAILATPGPLAKLNGAR